ncbi:hypothetical protein [Micromonospora eburnea]|uniref:Uncharacterized protein n=1 Tax=Micromonospora eburnea TaxID=227316 RepID=A0A1C6UX61_9ACTN|nr:hypothetical protein [Micromonospora eburnea]SCL58615.1 hypothetical protein GA0070604_3872 [Micromonospora eburnea]
MSTVQDFLTPEKREELLRMARGERDTSPKPMGIRATTGRTDRPTPPAATPPNLIGHVDHLLRFAMQSENSRTRALATKVHTLAVDLARRCYTEYTTRLEELDAEVAALEEKLADARSRRTALDDAATAAATPAPGTTWRPPGPIPGITGAPAADRRHAEGSA